ncbi:MAG: DUF3152 domain-containing protein [Actinomycetota bacterium]
MRATGRLIAVALSLVAGLVIPGAGSGLLAADHHDAPDVWGNVDLVDRDDGSTRVVGWVATGAAMAPTVRLVADGESVDGFVPTLRRIDAERVLPGAMVAWGWDVELDRRVADSLCASAVIDGDRRGIDCWHRSGATMLPALGGGEVVGTEGPLIKYSVEVEAATGQHPEDVARIIEAVLADSRSWAAGGDGRFQRVRPDRADERIYLATPRTTDRLCLPFQTGGRLSCNVRDLRIVFNLDRWLSGVSHWAGSIDDYRAYLINHEVGHSLDFRHVSCPGAGQLAPLMMQQTKSLGGCLPNPWPYPAATAAAGAPTCLGRVATIVVTPGQPAVGTSGDDVIVGTSGPDVIRGGGGDDVVCGRGGADDLRGNAGDDTIRGGSGADRIRGGRGDDDCRGGRGVDTVRGC